MAFADYSQVMPDYITNATIATTDNVGANYATNSWSFMATDLTALAQVHAQLAVFYQGIDAFMSSLVRSANGLELTSYARADTKPRAPVMVDRYTLNPLGSAPLPTEVALCLSFQAAKISGSPQSRRRGRVYIPFMDEAYSDTAGRPTSGLVTGLATEAQAFLAASDAAVPWSWHVWSTVGLFGAAVADGWVDNEWDTQRRRGRKATSRTTFT